MNTYFWILVPLAYLLGSVPMGILVVKALGGVDPRTAGSKNIGATNVGRTSGRLPGVLTLAGDMLKGAVPVFTALHLYPEPPFVAAVGLAAFVGHLWPVFLGFSGGKGVATALGVMIVTAPVPTLLCAIVFIAAVLLKRYVSLGSIVSAAMLPVFLSFFPRSKPYMPMGVIIAILIIIKHKENIKRLAEGRENKIGGKK
ncbi:MAG: glycerol-3-phosphate 1-O-acyltransferase PlsY [Deltaproteobacteria bacterium]|nr:glycerol-3-phosphate 1-O-acyltransferase PlsY [Deltaproteobacteria bacterium]